MIVVANDLAIYNVYNYDIMYKKCKLTVFFNNYLNLTIKITVYVTNKTLETRMLYPIIMAKHQTISKFFFHTKVTCFYNIKKPIAHLLHVASYMRYHTFDIRLFQFWTDDKHCMGLVDCSTTCDLGITSQPTV